MRACLLRASVVLALLFGPSLHASAMCEMSVTDSRLDLHAGHRGETGHSHSHGTTSDRHADGCCDTTCDMACTAMLTVVAAPPQPVVSGDNELAEPANLRIGSSYRPDPYPPKLAAPVAAA